MMEPLKRINAEHFVWCEVSKGWGFADEEQLAISTPTTRGDRLPVDPPVSQLRRPWCRL
jgi:hypothetical protein